MKTKTTTHKPKPLLLSAVGVIVFMMIGLGCWLYVELSRSPIGPPGPAETETANCTIQKDALPSSFGYASGTYVVFCGTQMYIVASSNENLDTFLDKKVKIKAKYKENQSHTDSVKTNIQCILGQCKQIFVDKNQSTYAIEIKSIQIL